MAGKQSDSTAKKLYDDALTRKLRMVISASDYTIASLADAAKIPRSTLYNIVRYKHAPSCFYISKICRVLNRDTNELLGVRRVDR